MKTVKLLFVLTIIINLASCSQENEEVYVSKITESKSNYSNMEYEILNLVNNYRDNLGLNKLIKLDIVSAVAFTHSNHMSETGLLSHDNFSDRHLELVNNANAKAVGENVGFGYNSAQSVFNAWIFSDSHKHLIEGSKFTHFGISIVADSNGRNYFTQIFIVK